MRHKLCKEFYEYWTSCSWGNILPDISCFDEDKLAHFQGYGLVLACRKNDIFIDYIGTNNNHIIPSQLKGACLADMVPAALKALQMALIMPCFTQRVGMRRLSRYSYVTHTMDVEMLMLPVSVSDTGLIALVGLCVSTLLPNIDVKPDSRISSIEQIISQDYISLGRSLDLSVLDGHTWAVLDTMGARLTVDGDAVNTEPFAADVTETSELGGSRIKVLAVARETEHADILERLGTRYDLSLVSTFLEARRILVDEMVDILVAAETCDDCTGLDLLRAAQAFSSFTTCVFMLNPRTDGEDALVEERGHYVRCLQAPFNSDSLKEAIDSAISHVRHFGRVERKIAI